MKAPGSITKHQTWPGGYIHHLEETMNIGVHLYKELNALRKLPFTLSDVILVLFLHDLEKPFKYVAPTKELTTHEDEIQFVAGMAKKYNIILTSTHVNALNLIHGEDKAYHPTKRVQKPLTAFVHVCDTISARIWFDYPRAKDR